MTSEPAAPGTQGDLEADLLRRTLRGGVALGLRQGLTLVVALVGGVLIARFLEPAQFAYYAIALVCLAAVSVIGDGGLGASLVRSPEEPHRGDLDTVFTFQLACTVALCAAGALVVLLLHTRLGLPREGVLTVLLTLAAPVVSTLKTVPTVVLERGVVFGPIGLAGVLESVCFNVVGAGGAYLGLGPAALGVGLVVGAVAGAVVVAVARPWRPRLRWQRSTLRAHLGFGLPYQGLTALSVAKDSVSPLVIGLVVGATELGYVEWAQRFAAYAVLSLFVVQRLLLTSLARLQERPESLARAVEVSLRCANAVVAPLALGVLVMSHQLVQTVFGRQWLDALPVFWWLWAANLFVPAAVVAVAVLNALGRSGATLRFTLLWMTTTWLFAVPLVLALGFVGYGVANLLVQLTNLWLFAYTARSVRFPWLRAALPAWSAGAVAVALAWAVSRVWAGSDVVELLVFGVVLALAYATMVAVLTRPITGLTRPSPRGVLWRS